MSDRRLISEMVSTVFRSIDSAGFNEQELADILEVLQTMASTPVSSALDTPGLRRAPSPQLVACALKAVARTAYSMSTMVSSKFISRLHFHSLPFHIIATIRLDGNAGQRQQKWASTAQERSVAAGASTASYRACSHDGQELTDTDIEIMAPLQFLVGAGPHAEANGHGEKRVTVNATHPVASWTEKFADSIGKVIGDITFFYTPVLVCRDPVRTVGLGDAISAAGLSRSVV